MIETKRFLLRLLVYPATVIFSFSTFAMSSRFLFIYIIYPENQVGPGLSMALGLIFGGVSLLVIAPIMTYLAMIWYDRRIGYKQKRKKAAHPH